MTTGIPDFTLDPNAPVKGKEGSFPDWIAPSVDESLCGEYAAVRNAVEQGVRPELKQGMSGDEILNRWCQARGEDRKAVVLTALRLNLATEKEYTALVAGEVAVEAGEHGVTEGLPAEEAKEAKVAAKRRRGKGQPETAGEA